MVKPTARRRHIRHPLFNVAIQPRRHHFKIFWAVGWKTVIGYCPSLLNKVIVLYYCIVSNFSSSSTSKPYFPFNFPSTLLFDNNIQSCRVKEKFKSVMIKFLTKAQWLGRWLCIQIFWLQILLWPLDGFSPAIPGFNCNRLWKDPTS